MRFSIEEPIRLLRKLHGLNPKAKTHFVVRLLGDQMEMAPACVSKEGKDPNEKEIHGDTKEALLRLAETLAFYNPIVRGGAGDHSQSRQRFGHRAEED